MKLRLAAVAFASLLAQAACKKDGGVAGVLVVSRVEVSPGTPTVVTGQTVQLTATPKTSSDIVVPGRAVTWSSSDNGRASVSGSGLVTGVAVGGPIQIRATVDGVTGEALVTIVPVPINSITVTPNPVSFLVGDQQQLTASAFASGGVPLTGRSFSWESSNPTIAAVTSTGMVIGVSPGGPVSVTASAEGKTGATQVTVGSRPATRLGFLQEPSTTAAGAFIAPPVRIAVQDNLLVTVAGATNPVTIALAGNSGGSTLSGTTTANAVNGVATFGNLSLNKVGTNYTFLVTSPGLQSVTSGPFSIIAGGAGKLRFATTPSTVAQSGAPLAQQPAVQLQDGSGNDVATPGVLITATVAPNTATLGGTVTATTNGNGTATFTNLTLTGTAGSYTLSFAGTGITPLTSAPIALGAGAATALTITQQPSSVAQNGVPLGQQPTIQLRDASGNPVPSAGVPVTVALASGTGVLGGGLTVVTNASGLATFTTVAINGGAGSYTLNFTSGSLTPVVSGPIVLGAGNPTKLGVTVQPSAASTSGAILAQQPAVQLLDASNNPVALGGVQINVAVSAGGTLGGTTSATTNGSGLATFSNLSVSGPSGSYTLTFSASGLTPVNSSSITLGAGSATKVGLTTQPATAAQSGIAFTRQPVAQIQDGSGNPVPAGNVSVTASIATGPAGGVLGGNLSVNTNAGGAATFTNLAITGPVGTYTLRFTVVSLTPVVSGNVVLSAGVAATIAANSVTTQSATVATAVAAPPSVIVKDASGNPVAGVNVTFAVTAGGGTVVPAGPATVATNASGIATATSWTLGPAAGTNNNTATASAAVPSGSPVTFTASGQTGPAAIISANSLTNQSATVGTAVSIPPSVKVTDAQGNPVAGVAVTFAATAGGGTVVPAGPTTVPTNASGIATATSWTLGPAAGTNNNTVTASAAVPSGSPVTFTASGTAAAAGNIAANSATTQTGTVNAAVGAPPSVKVTDAGNNPVAGVNVTFTVTAGGGSTNPASPAVVPTNGSGIATLTSWTLGTAAGSNNNTVTATAAGVPGSVVFTATANPGPANTVAANSATTQNATVGTAVAAPPSVLVTDQFGNPINGFAVSFAVTAGGGTVAPAAPTTVATNTSGIATATSWTLGTTAGTNTVTATAAGLGGSPVSFNATGTAGAAQTMVANSATTQSAVAGTAVSAPPSVKITDQFGNPVANIPVTFAITLGNGSVGAPATVNTNALGVATAVSWTLDVVAGTNNNALSASATVPVGSPVNFTASGTVGPAAVMTANSAVSQSGTVGTTVTPPSVKVTDSNGNPVNGFSVTFTLTNAATAGSIAPATPASVATNSSGIATLTTWTLGHAAGTNNNTVTATGVGAPVVFNASGQAGSAATIAANSATTQNATAGTAVAAPPSVKVTDGFGNPVQNTPVVFTVTAGGGTTSPASPATINTDVNGVATLTSWTLGNTAGANTLTAASGSLGGSPVTFNATGDVGPAAIMTANSATSQSAKVNTTVAAPPSVLVTDSHGNPVSGFNVTFTLTASSTGGAISPASPATVATNGSGIATLTSWTVGQSATNNNTISVSGVGPAVIFSATGTPDNATTIVANSVTTQSATAGSNVAAPPSVKVTDQFGNGVQTVGVVFTVTGGGGSINPASPATINTDATGVATLTSWTTGNTVGANTLTAGSGTLTNSPITFTANTTAGPPANIAALTSTSQTGTVGTTVTAPSVHVTDSHGNDVGGATVTFTVTAGNGSISPPSPAGLVTDAAGVATLSTWTLGTTAGTNTVTAAVGAVTPLAFNATGTANVATNIAANSATSQSGVVTSNAGAPPSVKVTDQFGNPVANSPVVFTLTNDATSGAISPASPATVNTDVNGIATLTSWTLGQTAGTNNNVVTAAASLTGSPVTFTASGTPSLAAKVVIVTQPASLAPTTPVSPAVFTQQPVVQVLDAFDNPIVGAAVTVTIETQTPPGSVLSGTVTVLTDATGTATYTNLAIADPGGYSLRFTAGTLFKISNTFVIP